MSIDPDELKVRQINREQKTQEIQNYLDQQDALDKENATGKLGQREIKKQTPPLSEKVNKSLNPFKKI